LADTRLKIAVFVDFDNIEIGVKNTLSLPFDIGVVLEALKERGDVVSKIAYGDWTRAGDYSRSLTQHATKLVQRNLTPGGDKNGADINLALDALEMAFTHSHINAYVIVGGDSDFISLVEKLKQYDKQIFVVGGRAFTSLVMQRNCHEFIAYENLVSSRRSQDRGQRSTPMQSSQAPLDQVVPLVRRALKVLADREVSPQLGLLKSTLLQLDSTFSERTYGAGSFRDFAQKLASAGHVVLRESGRNVLVELSENGHGHPEEPTSRSQAASDSQAQESVPPAAGRAADGIREIRRILQTAQRPPRWPMYIRQLKQYLRAADPNFDERRFGFESLGDLMRACQRDGLLRIERDRQGGMRIFPGNISQPAPPHEPVVDVETSGEGEESQAAEPWSPPLETVSTEDRAEGQSADGAEDVVDGDVVQEMDVPPILDAVEAQAAEKPARRRRREPGTSSRAARGAGETRPSRKPAEGSTTRSRKTPAKPRGSRARGRTESTSE
jgi:uncharacterized LabA/DUF88 family protein